MEQGMSLGSVVFVVLLILKLTNLIAWSWWWVTAPLWLPMLVALAIAGTVGLVAGMVMLIAKIIDKVNEK